jgi:hypothetical protein
MVKVVWIWKFKPDRSRIQQRFMIRKYKVHNVLECWWILMRIIKIMPALMRKRINDWESTFVAVGLLDTIGHVSDSSVGYAARYEFAMDNPDDDDTAHDLPFTSSGIVDVNNIAKVPNATTLNHLVELKVDFTTNVVTSSNVHNQ